MAGTRTITVGASALAAAIADTVETDDTVGINTNADERIRAMSAAIDEANQDIEDGLIDALNAGEIVITPELLAKDFTDIPDNELPVLPAGYHYRNIKSEDGLSYALRIAELSTAPAFVIDDTFRDGLELNPAIRNSPRFARFDMRWGSNSNPVDMKQAHGTGFVDVPAKHWNDPDNTYRKEGGKVVNGDLHLMMRPREVTDRRALEMAVLNEKRLGNKIGATRLELENIDPSGQYGRVEEAVATMSHGGNNDGGSSRKAANIAEQIAHQKRGQNARSVFSVNAPFQREIIGGRVVHDPGLSAAVGRSD